MALFLFRSSFETDSRKTILLSSSARGSKLIWICWYFYPPPLEIQSWSGFTDTSILLRSRFEADLEMVIFSLYWLYTWSPNLVLFRSCTWKPVRLDSVLVLHLKGQSNLVLFSPSTYLDLPLAANLVVLWLCHTYLLDWTYNSNAILGWVLEFFENFDLF